MCACVSLSLYRGGRGVVVLVRDLLGMSGYLLVGYEISPVV